MTDAELRNETRSVREEFSSISNSDVDDDAKIIELKAKLDAALPRSQAANEQCDRVRSVLGSLQGEIDQARSRIDEVDGQRAEVIAAALIDGVDFSNDDELLASRLDYERLVERLTLARPALERLQRQKYRAIELTRNPCAALEDQINHRRDELKLREERRRHGYE